jgi:hypothetical protein
MVKFFQQHMWNFEQYALFQLFDLRANYWHGRLARANQKKQGSEPAVDKEKADAQSSQIQDIGCAL